MSTQRVIHSSRTDIERLKFGVDGEVTWAFIPKMNGNMFNLNKTNITSFTIDGSSYSLPFTVVRGQTYSISIVKTDPSLPSELELNIRKNISETKEYNVPNFGAYKKRFIYCLSVSRETVYVIDSELLKASNYIEDGVFTTNPIVQTIALPILPNTYKWSKLEFVLDENQPKMLLCSDGTTVMNGNNNFYFGFINPDHSITNLDGTPFNSSSKLYTSVVPTNRTISQPQYDYINNVVYISEYHLITLDLKTKALTLHPSKQTLRLFFATNQNMCFNPFSQAFVYDVDYLVDSDKFHNSRGVHQTYKRFLYSIKENAYYMNANNTPNTILKQYEFGLSMGQNQGSASGNTGYISTISDELGTSIRATINNKHVIIYRLSDLFRTGNIALTFTTSIDFSGWGDVEVSSHSSLYLLLETTSSGTNKRIIATDWDGQVSYIDMPEAIYNLNANGLMI